jgi:hypothetical protein
VQGDGDKPQAIDITSEVIERDTDLESVERTESNSTNIDDIL